MPSPVRAKEDSRSSSRRRACEPRRPSADEPAEPERSGGRAGERTRSEPRASRTVTARDDEGQSERT
eukprot:141968-Alexandrium_andersonii.AAC.1